MWPGTARSGHDGGVSTDSDRRPELRAGDGDRQRVVERLRRAHGEGRLDLDEFDERITAAWAARTYGDLDALTADLPPEPAVPAPAPSRGSGTAVARGPDRGAVAAWLTASLVNVLIWGVVSVAAVGPVYPWWIWVAGPWGVLLLAQWSGAQRGQREG